MCMIHKKLLKFVQSENFKKNSKQFLCYSCGNLLEYKNFYVLSYLLKWRWTQIHKNVPILFVFFRQFVRKREIYAYWKFLWTFWNSTYVCRVFLSIWKDNELYYKLFSQQHHRKFALNILKSFHYEQSAHSKRFIKQTNSKLVHNFQSNNKSLGR